MENGSEGKKKDPEMPAKGGGRQIFRARRAAIYDIAVKTAYRQIYVVTGRHIPYYYNRLVQ